MTLVDEAVAVDFGARSLLYPCAGRCVAIVSRPQRQLLRSEASTPSASLGPKPLY